MRLIQSCLLGAVALLLLATPQVPAVAGDYPQVAHLKPFSPEANYMSLPGYVRYLTWEQDGIWLSRGEAVAIVHDQIEAASR